MKEMSCWLSACVLVILDTNPDGYVPFLIDIIGGIWNVIVFVPYHCLFVRNYLLLTWSLVLVFSYPANTPWHVRIETLKARYITRSNNNNT